MSENIRIAKLLLAEIENDIPREQHESYRLMIEALEELRKRVTTMSEDFRTAKLLLEETKNDIPTEQQESYQLMIEALEELRKID